MDGAAVRGRCLRLLLLGRNGQLGRELQRRLAPLGELVALDRHSTEFCGDLGNVAGLADTVRRLRPDVIVNAAAYTAVDRAETESDVADLVNARAPAVLAREAALLGAWLVHYSTDHVFDGSGDRPWREDDATFPVNTYGRSKLDGEQGIRNAGGNYLILRTGWVYGDGEGHNFLASILQLAQERECIEVVDDQFGSPTGVDFVAGVSARLIFEAVRRPGLAGLYHLAAGGETSRHGWARQIVEQARHMSAPGIGIVAREVLPVLTGAMPLAAKRPLNGRLECSKITTLLGLTLPPWQEGVDRALAQLISDQQTTR
ncbi:MAG: dTDP-4-dehydrorhamnose reductase [Polaromonas sp.]|nr:dTDP-4-dehydrorhamnose reductase [Polaromonas sp.]